MLRLQSPVNPVIKTLPIFLLFCQCLAAAGQASPLLTGRIHGLADGTKVWIVQSSVQKDSATVQNGVFRFYSHGLDSGVYSLRLCREYSATQWMDIYVGRVPMVIAADNTEFKGFRMQGPSWAADFTDYTRLLEINDISSKRKEVASLYLQAASDHTEASDRKAQANKRELDSLVHSLQWQWIQQHPASFVCSFILYTELQYSLTPEALDSVLSTIKDHHNMLYRAMHQDIAAYQATRLGAVAPLFIQEDIGGKPFRLQSLRGHYVLIDFWASWCGPCRKENPAILAAYRKYRKNGFRIVSVSLDEKKADWIKAVKHDQLIWTQVSDGKGWNNAVAVQYYIKSIPANFLISPDGRIVGRDLYGEALVHQLATLFGQ